MSYLKCNGDVKTVILHKVHLKKTILFHQYVCVLQ